MANSATTDVGLSDLAHLNSALYAGGNAQIFQCVGQCQRVNNRSQHAHIVSSCSVHALVVAAQTAPDIAAAINYSYLNTMLHNLFNLFSQRIHNGGVNTKALFTGHGLAAQFQNDAFVFLVYSHINDLPIHILNPNFYSTIIPFFPALFHTICFTIFKIL